MPHNHATCGELPISELPAQETHSLPNLMPWVLIPDPQSCEHSALLQCRWRRSIGQPHITNHYQVSVNIVACFRTIRQSPQSHENYNPTLFFRVETNSSTWLSANAADFFGGGHAPTRPFLCGEMAPCSPAFTAYTLLLPLSHSTCHRLLLLPQSITPSWVWPCFNEGHVTS